MKTLSFSLLALAILLTGCPDARSDSAPAVTSEAAAPEKAEAASGLKLEKLGLTIDLPADANIMDMLGTLMIHGGGTVVSVSEVKADGIDPKTFEEAKKAKADYAPTKVTLEEKTEDGWLITFENKGGAGANYFVWSRRTIDGKAYKCETTASTPEQATKAVAACKSLKK